MTSPPFSVLVVDDEPALRKTIRASLAASGFTVEEAGTGREAVGAVQQRPFDLVLLDVNMPGMSGVEACRQIRALAPRTGIVMVTVRDAEDDKVRALEAGADDYVTKPFRFRELVARIGAVLRRTHVEAGVEPIVLQAGDLKMDLDQRVVWKGNEQIRLSPKEFDLLSFLMKNQGAPMTHVKLLRAVWGPQYGNELEYLRTYVRMLRKKIEDDPAAPAGDQSMVISWNISALTYGWFARKSRKIRHNGRVHPHQLYYHWFLLPMKLSESMPPKVFISYSHDSREHQDRVLGLADRLREDGVDALIDQYEATPPDGWALWMDLGIQRADFVLLVCTDIYLRRVEHREEPGGGRGVLWEGRLIYNHLYVADSSVQKFIPILLERGEPVHIPTPLRTMTYYSVSTVQGYEDLYRHITGQP